MEHTIWNYLILQFAFTLFGFANFSNTLLKNLALWHFGKKIFFFQTEVLKIFKWYPLWRKVQTRLWHTFSSECAQLLDTHKFYYNEFMLCCCNTFSNKKYSENEKILLQMSVKHFLDIFKLFWYYLPNSHLFYIPIYILYFFSNK